MFKKKKKIFVGISGGVDSSVAAYLLKKDGYDVHGVFVKTWSPEWIPCTWVDEKRDAMRVCAALDIPFHFLDAEEEYKKGVADYMIAEYRAGRTPNPDVLCNRVIKFGVMWQYAKSCGATAIATGHYAQIGDDGMLRRAGDSAKDQAYFLWMLTREDLAHTLFPIGHLEKSEVRKIALHAGLFTGEKKDSQGICFLGEVDMKEFLLHYIEQKRGEVVDGQGKVIGHHEGVWFYTLGERHGFTISDAHYRGEPYYVVAKDVETNRLVVATIDRTATILKDKKVVLRDANWTKPPVVGALYDAQIRYHGELYKASFDAEGVVTLACEGPIPEGQSLVVFEGEALIGGGVIDKVI